MFKPFLGTQRSEYTEKGDGTSDFAATKTKRLYEETWKSTRPLTSHDNKFSDDPALETVFKGDLLLSGGSLIFFFLVSLKFRFFFFFFKRVCDVRTKRFTEFRYVLH